MRKVEEKECKYNNINKKGPFCVCVRGRGGELCSIVTIGLTFEGGAGRRVEAVTAVSTVAAGDVIVRVLWRGVRRTTVHLLKSSLEAER